MCGITGKIYFNDKTVNEQDILLINEKIQHRGPDDGGAFISADQKTGLGHRRLSIIDLSSLGHQPMNYLDRYWIVFNGEIYNFQEKKEMLQKEGYSFKSKTDTEVILALYDKFGKKCLDHLRGMFSFAIYDEKEKTIFCARDRIGKKPFKYYIDENVFIFASEIKAILTQSEYMKRPDYIAIHHYLTLQYVPAPLTGFENIKKLEPAHYLFIDLKTKIVEKKKYWRLDYSEKLDLSKDEWKKKITDKLEECVKLRMLSDVPLGIFLSGGIDSSVVVGMASKFSDNPVKTFSVGFEDESYNELAYARIIADKFKTEHREFIVKSDAIELLPMLVRQFEEPFADPSALPTYYVSKMTRNYVTVALNGDGGDENFAGYFRYSLFKLALMLEKISFVNKIFILPITRFFSKIIKNTFFDRAYNFAKTLSDNFACRYVGYICYFSNEIKNEIYTEEFKNKVWRKNTYDIIVDKFREAKAKNRMDQMLYADFSTYLSDDLMVKSDIDSMAVSLEGRSPFLDHELLELTAKIPANLKLKGMNNKKYILKEAVEGLIPEEIIHRKKMGFGVPIDHWFRNDLERYAKNILLSEKTINRKLFKTEKIRKILDKHSDTRINCARKIWALLVLELWFREYFD